ncbi:Alkylated DNA repair protein AlkB [Minicystis rosea]|nr:Alkylated DNA repair protein AlkB [Minicystis rosea]
MTPMRWPLEAHRLDDTHVFLAGELPVGRRLDATAFERLWSLRPDTFHEITMGGRKVKTPRWQQAYGADYRYTGNVNRALPVPDELAPLHAWARAELDDRLNGLLLNWYDADNAHYIGKHRDSIANMVHGAPIVTISFGAERAFRLRPWRGTGFRDFAARDGALFVMPWETNRAFTHEVPHSAASRGRRISVTLRAFQSERFD